MATGERRVLVEGGADARYVDTGHLVYMKTGTLMAVPFDAKTGTLTGAAVALADDVMQTVAAPNTQDETGTGQFAVSRSGTLIFITGGVWPQRSTTLKWFDREGRTQAIGTGLLPYPGGPRISPDGRRIALFNRQSFASDVWVLPTAVMLADGGCGAARPRVCNTGHTLSARIH